jgi:hypothetical protein
MSPPVSELCWQCHMCISGPYLYNVTNRCLNVLENGHLCQHQMCPQCWKYGKNLRRASGSVGPSVPNTRPSQPSGGTESKTPNAADSRTARSGQEENQDSSGRTSPAFAMPSGVAEGNSNTRELTAPESPVSDIEISSDESAQATPASDTNFEDGTTTPWQPDESGQATPASDTSSEDGITTPWQPDESAQATPASDTSSEDGTTTPWQPDLGIVNAVVSRIVHDWASQYRTPSTGPRTHAGGSRESEAPNDGAQQGSTNSRDAGGTRKRNHSPDGNNDDTNDQSQKRRLRGLDLDPDESTPMARLLACPFYKYAPLRYSEQNVTEKEYRGCSSCYLVNINRTK